MPPPPAVLGTTSTGPRRAADHAHPGRRPVRRAGRARALLLGTAVLVAAGVVAGCGLPAERTARPVASEESVIATMPTEPTSTGVVQIYLLRDGRLVAVDRAGGTADDALASLTAGPTPLDREAGLTTALPADLVRGVGRRDPGVVTVDVMPGFATMPARDQLLAAAQLTWTATGVCCGDRVRVLLGGVPVPLPTDTGLADRPVGRDDYRSLAPR